MLALVNKLLNKSQLQHSPNLWLTTSLNWPNRTMNFPSSFAFLEGVYRSWRVRPQKELGLLNWNYFLKSTIATKLTQFCPSIVGGFQSPTISRKYTDQLCVIDEESIKDHLIMETLIHAYQNRGHLIAEIDPLGIIRGPHIRSTIPENTIVRALKLPSNLSKVFFLGEGHFIGGGEKALPASEIIKRLEDAYCKSIGIEYKFIIDYDQVQFLKERFETPGLRNASISLQDKKLILKRLARAHNFEAFLGRKYPSVKRFGLEGCEVLIPAMKYMIDIASGFGVEHFIIGMAHRGRLNVIANVARKPLSSLFSKFRALPSGDSSSADVKYHLGCHTLVTNKHTNKQVTVTLIANPSHLEVVNPVVIGKTYAEQLKLGDKSKVWPILIHGDAAMTGQGIVYETFHLSELPCYCTEGVMHIIINNQVGFTSDPRMYRSSEYCTEVGKVLTAPILHVNGDDPEAVIYAMKVASEYKHTFKRSVVVDIVCYRRHGHSEADDPMFTQPIMYKKIKDTKPCFHLYSEHLVKENIVKQEEVQAIVDEYENSLEAGFREAEGKTSAHMAGWIDSPWKGFFKGKDPLHQPDTGVKRDILLKIGEVISTPPPDFEIYKSLQRVLNGRKKMIANNSVDYAIGEAFAFGSILEEGMTVRITGQDSERGTFSHRHGVYHHQSKDKITYTPLKHLSPNQGKFIICNSSLSEFGILGFEIGVSMHSPNQLVMWEAQFGDFSNTAQSMVDQYISSGESKWVRQSGIVMLLPHGMEGQGPEHSSSRPERYLQMCSDDDEEVELSMPKQLHDANWFIVNPTIPASLFHVLRRQVKLNYRKPLIIFTPKSLLRHPSSRSSIDDMVEGTKFKPYLKDEGIKDVTKVNKMFLCSGKIYFDLIEEREKRKLNDTVAISRLEQLFPFPYADIIEDAKRYPNAQLFWVQEEHKNMGFWQYAKPRLQSALPGRGNIKYLGRAVSASPATGLITTHGTELKQLLNSCFS